MSGWVRNERGNLVKRWGLPKGDAVRGSYPCPAIASDRMDPLQHVDGKMYDSKAAFRAVTKAQGYVEVGNDPARFNRPAPPKPDRAAIRDAVGKAISQSGI